MPMKRVMLDCVSHPECRFEIWLTVLVYRIEEYIPDSLFEQYENLRDLALDWMIRIGLIGKGDKGHVKSTSDSPRTFLPILASIWS